MNTNHRKISIAITHRPPPAILSRPLTSNQAQPSRQRNNHEHPASQDPQRVDRSCALVHRPRSAGRRASIPVGNRAGQRRGCSDDVRVQRHRDRPHRWRRTARRGRLPHTCGDTSTSRSRPPSTPASPRRTSTHSSPAPTPPTPTRWRYDSRTEAGLVLDSVQRRRRRGRVAAAPTRSSTTTLWSHHAPGTVITYDYAFDGEQLTLDMVDDQCGQCGGDVGELIAQTIIFETAPFTLVEPAGSDVTAAAPGGVHEHVVRRPLRGHAAGVGRAQSRPSPSPTSSPGKALTLTVGSASSPRSACTHPGRRPRPRCPTTTSAI